MRRLLAAVATWGRGAGGGGRDLVLGQQLVQLGVVGGHLLLALLALQYLVDEPIVGGLGRRRWSSRRLLGELVDVLGRLTCVLVLGCRQQDRCGRLAGRRALLLRFFSRSLLL